MMTHRPIITHALLFGAVILLSIAFMHEPILNARPGGFETEEREVVMFIGRLNADSAADTLIGLRSWDAKTIPDRIAWGRSDGASGNGDGNGRRVSATRIRFPQWRKLRVSVAIHDLNADSLADLVLHVRARRPDTTEQGDTTRALVLFGQSGLDTLAQISPATIGRGLQSHPYFALPLRHGIELESPAIRDASGRTSYILPRLGVSVRGDSTGEPGILTSAVDEPWVSVYPNPAVYATTLEARRISPGEYRVVLIAVNGQQYSEQHVTVGGSGELFGTLDLAAVPTGYYIVQIHARGRLVGSHPVAIVH